MILHYSKCSAGYFWTRLTSIDTILGHQQSITQSQVNGPVPNHCGHNDYSLMTKHIKDCVLQNVFNQFKNSFFLTAKLVSPQSGTLCNLI